MQLPDQTKSALTYLLQTASAEGVTVAGFAFKADPPAITNFGNCPDHGDIKLYELLCEMTRAKQAKGLVVAETVQKPV